MNKHVIAVCALAAAATVSPLAAQTLDAIEEAEEAVVVVADTAPEGFGIYLERAHNEFAPGEPVIVYAEPVGYGWHENDDGTYTFGFDIDLLLKRPDGAVVGGQENFQHLELTSRVRNREFMLTLTLTVDGAPPGAYVVEYTARDIASDKQGVIALPFFIVDR